MNKKFLILLGVSLALNFVFIGYEAGRLVSRPAFPDIPARRPLYFRGKGSRCYGIPIDGRRL